MKPYLAYIRVSTAKQEQGASLAAQREAIERYATIHGLPIGEWHEEVETAAKSGRRIFNTIVRKLTCGEAAGVILHKIDRGARNLRDWADLGELLDRGVDVHFANDGLDLRSRGGRLSADIQAVVAADYIRNLREECLKGMYARLRQGLFPLPAPLGYLNAGRGKPKMPDPLRAPLISLAFELYASGRYSLHTLAAELERVGLRNPRGTKVAVARVSTLLRNPFYAGTLRFRDETFEGIHEPLVTRALFNKVEAVLAGRRRRRNIRPIARHRYTRRLVCDTCTRHLVGEVKKSHTYYRCHLCPGICLREERVDEALTAALAATRIGSMVELIEALQVLEPTRPRGRAFRTFLMQPALVYARATPAEQRDLFELLVEQCTIAGKIVEVRLKSPCGTNALHASKKFESGLVSAKLDK